MKINIKYAKIKIISLLLLIIVLLFQIYNKSYKWFFHHFFFNKKRIGVISLPDSRNVGTMLVKFAMFTKLKELGFNATIISPIEKIDPLEIDSSFLNKTIKSHLLYVNNNFSGLNEGDFDYLMVNSDQTWGFYNYEFFYNVALLKFAENWRVNKFIYATSNGRYEWYYNKKDENLFKNLLKTFTGISFREIGTVKILQEKLGLKSIFVLDPTLLIDKHYYLEQIKNYKSNFYSNHKFLFVYQLDENPLLIQILQNASKKFHLEINKLKLNETNYIENFIYGISNCQSVITDSYHGTIFSIIFNKPFISFSNSLRGKARFDSLKEVFNLENRIIESSNASNIDINLLIEFPNLNKSLINELKISSLKFLKKNLDLI